MLRKVMIFINSVILVLAYWNCYTLKNQIREVFKIRQAYYQPWIVSKDEKGTDIIIELTHVSKDIDFDSVVFRGVSMKAFAERKNERVKLKSILPVGISRIINLENKVVNLPDQLIYHYEGKRMSYPLKMIRRKADKVY